MKVVMIGSGNVATVICQQAHAAGHCIAQVFSRQINNAQQLANTYHASAVDTYENIIRHADLYVVALTDTATGHLPLHWRPSCGLVVHTAGALPLEAMAAVSEQHGVLYPLQSLLAQQPPKHAIPWLVDANTENGRQVITAFAQSLGGLVQVANNEERKRLHLAAVLVNNFGNHLLQLAYEFCEANKLPFALLQPLIEETAQRLQQLPPAKWQTGPARRNDQATMATHLQLLEGYPTLSSIYQLFSNSISMHYHAKSKNDEA